MQVARWVCLVTFVSACGGNVVDDVVTTGADAGSGAKPGVSEAGAADASDADNPTCETSSGVRLCGPGCASSDAECPGLGCVSLVDPVSGLPMDMGLCLADVAWPVETCRNCADADTCVSLEGEGMICVAEDVCAALHQRGRGGACRYADFSEYDGRALQVVTGTACPVGSCGPGCGECDGVAVCSGRSADFGYGFCFAKQDPVFCSANEPLDGFCDFCLTWQPPSSSELALDYGVCALDYQCDEYEATGRLSCHPG